MKLILSILICLVSVLAPVGASAQGSDWRSVLKAEKAKNADQIAAIQEEGNPIADRLNQITAAVKRHNANPCTYREGHESDCAAYEREASTLNSQKGPLVSRLTQLVNEKERLETRNAEIDRQLACRRALQPCSENSDCCSGNCALFADGRLSDAHVCQPR